MFYILQCLLDVVFLSSAKWAVIGICFRNSLKLVCVFLCVLPRIRNGQFASKYAEIILKCAHDRSPVVALPRLRNLLCSWRERDKKPGGTVFTRMTVDREVEFALL